MDVSSSVFHLYSSPCVCPVWFHPFKRSGPFYTLTYIRPRLYIYFAAFVVNYFDFMTAAAFPSPPPPPYNLVPCDSISAHKHISFINQTHTH